MNVRTAALVGTAGGVGTTRTAVELAGALARAGRSTLVFDVDVATQGLALSTTGRLDPDATALLTDPDLALADAVVEWDVPGEGRLDVCPAHAPFVDVAEAMTPGAAERLGDRLREATGTYDHVLVDTPPIASNPAIAAVDAADRVAAVFPPTDRGIDSLQRTTGRLQDVGSGLDLAIAVGGEADEPPADADAVVPTLPPKPAPDRPISLVGDGNAVATVAETAAALFEIDLAMGARTSDGGVLESVKKRLS